VTLFLSSSVNDELEPKLRRELRPGTRIVSHQFGIGRWAPEKTVRVEEDRTNLYLWRVPAPARLDAPPASATPARSSDGVRR
jgi:hypothetical protein